MQGSQSIYGDATASNVVELRSSRSGSTKLLPLTLNGRGLGFEPGGISSILIGVAKHLRSPKTVGQA